MYYKLNKVCLLLKAIFVFLLHMTDSLSECLSDTFEITIIKTYNGPGDFGFGLNMNQDNTITIIRNDGSVFKNDMGESLKVGMRIIAVNGFTVDEKQNVTFIIKNRLKDVPKITLLISKTIHPIFENFYNWFSFFGLWEEKRYDT